jgi:benzoyl-CoA reductase/2-hydroxyglutaryl-CoA dehydratase subunit BcrC/BadD/HgdB
MMSVAYYSPFVPAEWIRAHGLAPRRRMPRAAVRPALAGICPFARAFYREAVTDPEVDAIVLTSDCDQVRRIHEAEPELPDKALFHMHVPATWQTAAAHRYYVEELRRLGRFLVSLGGEAPSPSRLAETMREADAGRRERPGLPEGEGVPVAVVGGPLMLDDERLFSLLAEMGARVVLDGTDTGPRSLPAAFDRRGLADDPLLALADAYFGSIPMIYRRPNYMLFRWLGERLPRCGAKGIVLKRFLWCDLWHAEEQRIREWSGLPVIAIDAAGDDLASPRTTQRLEAFVEMLR